MLTVILAFVMVMREGRTKYEKQDFFKQPAGRRSPQERRQQPRDDSSYSSRWDRQNNERSQSTPEGIQRNAAIFVISIALVAVVISIYTESLIGLFIILSLPMLVSFLRIRSREGERRRTSTDRGDSSSST